MGAFASVPDCQAHYNITLNCQILDESNNSTIDHFNGTWPANVSLGGVYKGGFEGDADIAGVGILGVFVAVTSFALAASIGDVLWQFAKTWKWKKTYTEEEKRARRKRLSLSDILETLVLACSDQQVFIGAAYALTLRYYAGCKVSAYHYNIAANMLLLTCATHLMSVTIVRNYWKYPWLAKLRILCISGVFIVTGLLFTNQNGNVQLPFPTEVPLASEVDSLIFLPAACFQASAGGAIETFKESTKDANSFFNKTLHDSSPGNLIEGWNWYVLTLLFYGAAIIAEAIRFLRRGKSKQGWRGRVGKQFGRVCGLGTFRRKVVQNIFLIYLVAGVGITCATTIKSTMYIFDLRRWVDKSGWIMIEDNGNPENDATSFGQLVPIFSSALILFSFAQMISEKATEHWKRKHAGEERPPQDAIIQYLDPSNYDLLSPPPPVQEKYTTEYFGAAGMHSANTPPRVSLQHQPSWGSTMSVSHPNLAAAHASSPMLVRNDSGITTPVSQLPSTFPPNSHPNDQAVYSALPQQAGSSPSPEARYSPSPHAGHGSPIIPRTYPPALSRPLMGSPTPSQQFASRPVGPSRSSKQLS
ncbi:Uu.00g062480.m01.CDS01 [Anthostomella pinea]|uniref:Uu.00g062480.m01.CDS01 n=1 Tax=Anthostomella pinea TaxID=933095 RepID=A0AAI8YMW1_9PEZI|nr:Uu.00g062480.m01.CDS01 [Anthostomella pinea]